MGATEHRGGRRAAGAAKPLARLGRRCWPGQAGSRSDAARRERSWMTDFVWIWQTRLSVPPRIETISARGRPQKKGGECTNLPTSGNRNGEDDGRERE